MRYKDEIGMQLSYQEGIIQDTRSAHYVFQALFIAIAIAITICFYTIVYTSEFFPIKKSESRLEYVYAISAHGAMVFLLCTMRRVSAYGSRLNKKNASAIYKRGQIIDMIQHISLVAADEKLSLIKSRIISNDSESVDGYNFTQFIKVSERVIGNSIDGYFDFLRKNSEKKSLQIRRQTYNYIIYLSSVVDIYDTKYLYQDDLDAYILKQIVSGKSREITLARSGYGAYFEDIWLFLNGNMLIMMFIIFLSSAVSFNNFLSF